ncbi:TRAP transporter small permease [Paracoccus fontiphilus]|uniref:TRAP transporter small permease n=1 Tax=Paracoccus fontiphilus TaxID=1815556 RepID=UPI001A97CA4E|nr:TRAP transporter small permease [Paracoccus fontiphilus]
MERLGRLALLALRVFMVAALTAMIGLVFLNVVLRYGFNSGISISEEVSRTLFVWLIFMGAVLAMYDHGHLGVDSLVRRLPRAGQIGCAILCDALMLFCSGLLMVGSWKQVLINWGNAAPVSGLPIGLTHLAAFVCSIGLVLVIGAHLWRVLTGRAGSRDLVQVVESEDLAPEIRPEAAR